MRIVRATAEYLGAWAELRFALWPWDDVQAHAEEADELYLSGNPDRSAFVALGDTSEVIGFAEATLRRDYVEGCDTSPVVFLEGIFIKSEQRQSGIARALSDAVADWGRSKGCTEYASNALLNNVDSHAFHAAIGFEETERVVFFRKDLT